MHQEQQSVDLKKINENVADAMMTHEPAEQYLTFVMDHEEYGVDILSVQEIRGWEPATAVPNAPDYVKGVLNLRGTVVPIVDLRTRFGITKIEYTPTTVVIVVKISSDNRKKVIGIVVDAVADVHSFTIDDIQPSPEISGHQNTAFVKGLGSVDEKMVILLDINALLTADASSDLSGVHKVISH